MSRPNRNRPRRPRAVSHRPATGTRFLPTPSPHTREKQFFPPEQSYRHELLIDSIKTPLRAPPMSPPATIAPYCTRRGGPLA